MVIFGGWTSASRKAMKPVVEGLDGLLFYPVQYEGLEVSPNIFYTGATTNQQIIPGLDYLKEKGLTKIFLVGSDYVFPRTANKEIKAYAAANGMEILGEEYLALGDNNVQGIVQKVLDAKPQVVFNTLNGDTNVSLLQGAEGQGQHAGEDPDHLGVDRRGGDGRRRRRQPRRPPGGVELLPDHRQPPEQGHSSPPSRPSTAPTSTPTTPSRPGTTRSTSGRRRSRRPARSTSRR